MISFRPLLPNILPDFINFTFDCHDENETTINKSYQSAMKSTIGITKQNTIMFISHLYPLICYFCPYMKPNSLIIAFRMSQQLSTLLSPPKGVSVYDLLFEKQIGVVTKDLLYILFTYQIHADKRGVSGLATDPPCAVWAGVQPFAFGVVVKFKVFCFVCNFDIVERIFLINV